MITIIVRKSLPLIMHVLFISTFHPLVSAMSSSSPDDIFSLLSLPTLPCQTPNPLICHTASSVLSPTIPLCSPNLSLLPFHLPQPSPSLPQPKLLQFDPAPHSYNHQHTRHHNRPKLNLQRRIEPSESCRAHRRQSQKYHHVSTHPMILPNTLRILFAPI